MSSIKNNFQELEALQEVPRVPKQAERGLFRSIELVKLFGNIIELYLPKAAEIFVSFTGGDTKQSQRPNNNQTNKKIDQRPNYNNRDSV